MNCDEQLLESYVFDGLGKILCAGDTLDPRYLEMTVCRAFGLQHVGDGNFYADGINITGHPSIQASVKTRMINPDILKTKEGRDFSTHPDKFLGPRQNKSQGKWWGGLEFVQRRQEIVNESNLSPAQIGKRSMVGFLKNIRESKRKFKTDKTYEILLTHGYNWTQDEYLVNVYWQELTVPKINSVTWVENSNGVDGLINNQIVMHRVRGGAKREATCFKEYKDPTKYAYSAAISVPIPVPKPLDVVSTQAEIARLRAFKQK
jgi:hypothetical protein